MVLSSRSIQSYACNGDLYVLGRFVQEWPQLQAGGLLLPDLIEFYQWLHTVLGEPVLHSSSGVISCRKVTLTVYMCTSSPSQYELNMNLVYS